MRQIFWPSVLGMLLLLNYNSSAQANEPTLRFARSTDTLLFNDCASLGSTVEIYNTADTSQILRFSPTDSVLIEYSNAPYNSSFEYYVPPRDTIWIHYYLAKVYSYSWRTDTITLLSAGGGDTLSIWGRRYADTITIKGDLNIGRIRRGDSLYRDLVIENNGSFSYPLKALDLWMLSLDSLTLSQNVLPGESKTIRAYINTSSVGRFNASFRHSQCVNPPFYDFFEVYDHHAYFSEAYDVDSIIGCRPPSEPQVASFMLHNDSDSPEQISSIDDQFGSGWIPADSSWRLAEIPAHDSIPIRFLRHNGDISTAYLFVKTLAGAIAPFMLRSEAYWSRPRFYVDIDTLRLHGSGTDHFFDQFWLTADGNFPSVVTALSISDSVHWEVSGVDVGDTLGTNRLLLLGETRFKGATTSGDYPVTLRVTTSPCDTVLTRTVIMRVSASDVRPSVVMHPLQVYPTPATDILHVIVSSPATLHLLDILGKEVVPSDTVLAQRVA